MALWTGRGCELKHSRGSDDDGQAVGLKENKYWYMYLMSVTKIQQSLFVFIYNKLMVYFIHVSHYGSISKSPKNVNYKE